MAGEDGLKSVLPGQAGESSFSSAVMTAAMKASASRVGLPAGPAGAQATASWLGMSRRTCEAPRTDEPPAAVTVPQPVPTSPLIVPFGGIKPPPASAPPGSTQ